MKSGAVHALNTTGEENLELKLNIAKLKGQIEATESELKESQENQRENVRIINRMKEENMKLNNEKEMMNHTLNEMKIEIENLNKNNNDKDTMINNLNNQCQMLQEKIDETENSWKQNESRFEDIMAQVWFCFFALFCCDFVVCAAQCLRVSIVWNSKGMLKPGILICELFFVYFLVDK